MIKQRIENIRDLMKEKNIYAYIVPSSDYHQSEYVGDYFKSREFITGRGRTYYRRIFIRKIT